MKRLVAAVVAALMLAASPAWAHTSAEQVEWFDSWQDSLDARPQAASILVPFRFDFERRHRIASASWEPCSVDTLTASVDTLIADRATRCRTWSIEYLPPPTTTTTTSVPQTGTQAESPTTTKPASISRSSSSGMGSDVEQWRPLVAAHFGGNTDAALRVMRCESGGNPNARNKSSGASGLFQFMPFWWKGKWDPFDPSRNVKEAAKLSKGGSDWSHWTCKP